MHLAPLDVASPWGVTRKDYQGSFANISPVADPRITSDSMGVQRASLLKQAAATTPGYNLDEVEKRFLKALKIDAIDVVFPGTEGAPPPEDPKLALEKLKGQNAQQLLQMELQAEAQQFQMELLEERRLNNAKIIELMAKAENAAASAATEETYAQVATINAEISQLKARNDALAGRVDRMLKMSKIDDDYDLGLRSLSKAAK